MKIFFDMDGVLVDFAGGGADAIQQALEAGDTSRRQFRRLVNYDGPVSYTHLTLPTNREV